MFAIEVEISSRGWTRLKGRYATKKCASDWYRFVKAAWGGLPLRTVEVAQVVLMPAAEEGAPPGRKEVAK